jgi:hypothetical protein
MPVGGSIGIRQQVIARPQFDLAVARRSARVQVGTEDSTADRTARRPARAGLHTVQGAFRRVRPLISVAGIGARMTRVVDGVARTSRASPDRRSG